MATVTSHENALQIQKAIEDIFLQKDSSLIPFQKTNRKICLCQMGNYSRLLQRELPNLVFVIVCRIYV